MLGVTGSRSLPHLFTHLCVCVFEYAYFKQICGQLSVAVDDSVSRRMFILKYVFFLMSRPIFEYGLCRLCVYFAINVSLPVVCM